jgi:hypothetical protein
MRGIIQKTKSETRRFVAWAWSYQQKFSDLRNFQESQKILNLPFLSECQKNYLADVLAGQY